VDEFDLPGRHEWEAGSAPDHAVLWDDRRPGQLPGYFELAAHHYPAGRVDLTYLTPPMPVTPPATGAGCASPTSLAAGRTTRHRGLG
jgi:hypothetical protein